MTAPNLHLDDEIVVFQSGENRLLGILSRPESIARPGLGVLLFSPGLKHRVGPHGQQVKLARFFTSLGLPVFRFDFHGTGDSEGQLPESDIPRLHLAIQKGLFAADALAALDAFTQKAGLRRVIACGLCGGAITAVHAAARDKRIDGICGFQLPVRLEDLDRDFTDTVDGGIGTFVLSLYLRKLISPDAWKRFLTGHSEYRLILTALRRKLGLRPRHSLPAGAVPAELNPDFLKSWEEISGRVRMQWIYSATEPDWYYFQEDFEGVYLRGRPRSYEKHLVPLANHEFAPDKAQTGLLDAISGWLRRQYGLQARPQAEAPTADLPRVLMVSHSYPPSGGSGMLRALKFSRYLPSNGWQPIVLTLRRTHHPRRDPRLVAEIPSGISIYRSPSWNPLELMLRLRETILARRQSARGNGGAAALKPEDLEPRRKGLAGLLRDIFTTPDQYAGWFLPGLLAGLWAVLRHRPQVIFSTSPPATAHLIGRCLSCLTRLPLVMDFRDPWTLHLPPGPAAQRRQRWNRRLERHLLGRADRIICNTQALSETMRRVYSELDPERVEVLMNGFDPADFSGPPAAPPSTGPFVFLHTGEFFPVRRQRVPDPFLEALRDLLTEEKLAAGQIRVLLVGSGEYAEMEPFLTLTGREPLRSVVELVDHVSHDEIPALLESAHVLLLFQNSHEFFMQVPAKVFEYIRAERPILAIAPDGESARLVGSLNGGRAVDPGNLADMKQAIVELVAARGGTVTQSPELLARFSRPAQAEKLARILDETVGRGD